MARKALIVEDSPTMRKLIKFCLKKSGLNECVEASNGLEALQQISLTSFDLILTDINMPDMNGVEFITNLRKNVKHSKTPIIVITTEGNRESKEEAFSAGADAYVPKPFKPEDLQDVIDKVVTI